MALLGCGVALSHPNSQCAWVFGLAVWPWPPIGCVLRVASVPGCVQQDSKWCWYVIAISYRHFVSAAPALQVRAMIALCLLRLCKEAPHPKKQMLGFAVLQLTGAVKFIYELRPKLCP